MNGRVVRLGASLARMAKQSMSFGTGMDSD